MKLSDYIFEVAPKAISYELARRSIIKKAANPLTITYSVTAACRSLCKTCNIGRIYLDDPDRAKADLTLDEIEKTFKSLGPIYFFNVSGGEPFMRLDLPDIIKLAFKYLKPRLISIPTNSLAPKTIEKSTLKILDYMDKYAYPNMTLSIKPSVDGVGEMHDFVRGIKGNFVRLEETIDRLLAIREKDKRLHVDLGTVISNLNLHHLDELEEWVHKRGIESYRHEIAEQRVEFSNIGDPITPAPEVYEKLIEVFKDKIVSNISKKVFHTKVTEAVRLAYYDVALDILKKRKQVTPCYGGLSNIHLDYNGEMWPCCILGGEKSMGNIRDFNYDAQKLLASTKSMAVKKYIADGNCACPLASQWLNNILLTPQHMIKTLYTLFVKFSLAKESKEEATFSSAAGEKTTFRDIAKQSALILKKAGTIPTPEDIDMPEFIKGKEENLDHALQKEIITCKVLKNESITDKNYILTIERKGIDFVPGQYCILSKKGSKDGREYTIFSGTNDDEMEFLITEVDKGIVSTELRTCKPGDEIELEGPTGYFRLDDTVKAEDKHIFIATGSGVSPFHAMIKSNPDLNYQLIHGVRTKIECFGDYDFDQQKYVSCISREDGGDFKGRVTDYLRDKNLSKNDFYYICGNNDMLFEVYDILINKGIPAHRIKDEVFY